MDLTEGKKSWNVWKLESEAFKKPIEIKIWYDNKELVEFKDMVDLLRWEIRELVKEQAFQHKEILERKEANKNLYGYIQTWIEEFRKLRDKCDEKFKQQNELLMQIADLKTTVETLSGAILHLQDEIKLIQKKITKVPMVFHDKSFISWRESSGLWMIDIPDGDYLLIAKYVVWEHNEFVTNQNELLMDTIHVEGQHYIPFYKLEWGTELDTPTATIYYDLVFIPM